MTEKWVWTKTHCWEITGKYTKWWRTGVIAVGVKENDRKMSMKQKIADEPRVIGEEV